MTQPHLLLVDASAIAFRAFYSWSPAYRESDGMPIGAILGFMGMTWRMLGAAAADKPTHGAAVFDAPGLNFRHKLFPAYKANRDPARRVELDPQMPYMRHAAQALGLTPVEKTGFEADDLIATLAHKAAKAGWRTTIVSSDKDFGQLVRDGEIEIVDPMAKRRLLEADIEKKFGVRPSLVPDVQALAGDAVDGIPGIKGCGGQRAAALVRRFGSLEKVLENTKGIHWPGVRYALKKSYPIADMDARTGAEWTRLFLRLTTLRRTVPLEVKLPELALHPILKSSLDDMLKSLGATNRMQSLFGLDVQSARTVEKASDPLEWWREELLAPGQKIPDEPQCGFYQRRLVFGGPLVAARIWREPETDLEGKLTGREFLRCQLGERLVDPRVEWDRLCRYPIKEGDFHFEIADADHAKRYRPNHPKANPRKPVDILKMPAQHSQASKKRTTP